MLDAAGVTSLEVLMPQSDADLDEIVRDIGYRVDLIWPVLMRELNERTGGAGATDLPTIEAYTTAAIDHVWGYVLGLCQRYQIRPDRLVAPTRTALGYFRHALGDHLRVHARHAPVEAIGATQAAVERHIEVTAREALVGYAGGMPVFPQSDWPDTWFNLNRRKAIAAVIFVLGGFTALALERLFRFL